MSDWLERHFEDHCACGHRRESHFEDHCACGHRRESHFEDHCACGHRRESHAPIDGRVACWMCTTRHGGCRGYERCEEAHS